MEYNLEQKNVIYYDCQNIMLIAGAGTGKTSTIVGKINYLIEELNIKPKEILTITFTNKACKELKERIVNKDVNIYTFHGFCYSKIKSIINKKIFDIENSNIKLFNEENLLDISNYKNQKTDKKPKIYDKYQKYLDDNNLIDFDDIINLYLKLLNDKQIIKNKFKYILVDEFQDTNNIQYELLKKIKNKNTKIIVVGDPDQSIYSFRGANYKIIFEYINDFNAKVFYLTLNYRSNNNIIKLANKIILENKDRIKKNLITNNYSKNEVELLVFENLYEEAKYLYDLISKLVFKNNYLKKDICIMYRKSKRRKEIFKKIFFSFFDYDSEDKINFLTIHESKGLEFKVVILLGLEDGNIPTRISDNYLNLEEERRLFFVAVTRAKEKLYLTFSKYNEFGYKNKKSNFLVEIQP